MLNSVFVIAAVGCLIAFVFMAGQGLAHHLSVIDVVSDRWYLLAGFIVSAGLGLVTRGRRGQSDRPCARLEQNGITT